MQCRTVHVSKQIVYIYYVHLYPRNSFGVPIYENPPPKYSALRIMQILLDPSLSPSKVASDRPVVAERSSIFIIDVRKVAHPDDIKKMATAVGYTKADLPTHPHSSGDTRFLASSPAHPLRL